jgi:hypothetical protein
MDLQAIPKKVAQPAQDELRALTSLTRQCWFLVDGRKTINHLAYMLEITDDATVEQVIQVLQEKQWIRL